MQFEKAYIPYGGYWSTPFCRWQGSFAHLQAMNFAAEVAVKALAERKISPEVFDGLYLGWTVPQKFGLLRLKESSVSEDHWSIREEVEVE